MEKKWQENELEKHLAVDDDDIVRVFSKKPALGCTRHDTTKKGQAVKIDCKDWYKVARFSDKNI